MNCWILDIELGLGESQNISFNKLRDSSKEGSCKLSDHMV